MCALADRGERGFGLSFRKVASPTGCRPTLLPGLHLQARFRLNRSAMGVGAGPRPGFCIGDQTGSHRVQFRVAQGYPQMLVIERTRIKTSLPNVSAGLVSGVPIRSV